MGLLCAELIFSYFWMATAQPQDSFTLERGTILFCFIARHYYLPEVYFDSQELLKELQNIHSWHFLLSYRNAKIIEIIYKHLLPPVICCQSLENLLRSGVCPQHSLFWFRKRKNKRTVKYLISYVAFVLPCKFSTQKSSSYPLSPHCNNN